MEEKIKLLVPTSVYKKIYKDCETFQFIKKEGQPNYNLFLNTIILNFYQAYTDLEKDKKEDLKKLLQKYNIKKEENLITELFNYFCKSNTTTSSTDKTMLSFKPTKISETAVDFISNYLIKDMTLSAYYRGLFEAYSSLPQYEREKIALKDSYDTALKALKENKKIYILLKNGTIIKEASIYTIKASTEELFNYMLIENANGNPTTIRLSKIKSIQLTNTPATISTRTIQLFEKQIKYGIQYPLYSLDEEEVIVKFTQEGLKMFKKIYLYRPIPDKIKGNIYYFNCSHYQIIYYFKRFGTEAIVLSPKKLTRKLQKFYYNSNINYLEELDIQLETMAIEK